MKTKLLKLALCAMATLPIGAWGQTLDFSDYSDKTSVGDAKDLTVQSENFKIHFYCGKAKVKEQELYYATSGASTIEKSFTYVYQSGGTIAQTSEESDRSVAMYIPCDGKLTIYARRNTTETTVKVIQNSSEISNTTLNGENEGAGTIGGKTCYKPITVDVVAGMAYVTSTYEINFSGFKFEEKLDTKVGGVANLDGFIKTKDKYIYIEAKRREIYGASHANEKIKVVYKDVYNTIQELVNNFNFEMYGEEDEEGCKKCTFKICNKVVKYFDLKQLICHFLGITYDIAKHNIKDANAKFVYLIYNPKEVEVKISEKYKDNIVTRYENVATFINKNAETIKNIFNAVLNYQTERHKLPKTSIDFEFFLVDQYNYKDILK